MDMGATIHVADAGAAAEDAGDAVEDWIDLASVIEGEGTAAAI